MLTLHTGPAAASSSATSVMKGPCAGGLQKRLSVLHALGSVLQVGMPGYMFVCSHFVCTSALDSKGTELFVLGCFCPGLAVA